jgi:hypothetical protein
MANSLRARDRDAFEKFVEDSKGGWPDAFKEYVRLASAKELADKDAEIARLNDIVGRQKVEGRSGQGPNLASTTSGGGKLYSQMSREERSKLSPQERDAAIAREQQGA